MYQKGKIELKCPTCKTIFFRWRCQVDAGSGKFCSKKCFRPSKEWKKQRSLDCLAQNNPYWGGRKKEKDGCTERVALHTFIKFRLKKPKKCSMCKEIKRLDLANISQEYKREVSDWEWLCRRCHMMKDGRLTKLHSLKRTPKPLIKCKNCEIKTKNKGLGYCSKCYERIRYWTKRRSSQTEANLPVVDFNKAIEELSK